MFLVFGSSASGKTVVLEPLRKRVPDLAVHDFDEIGVSPAAGRDWRLQGNEEWLRRAAGYPLAGRDMLLAGNTPPGEILASHSALLVDGISACLLDCEDAVRLERLRSRGEAWLERAGAELADYLAWAERLRRHAADPALRVHSIDTSRLKVDQVADELARWISLRRPAVPRRSEIHPR